MIPRLSGYEVCRPIRPATPRHEIARHPDHRQPPAAELAHSQAHTQIHFTEDPRNHPEDRAAPLFLDSANDPRREGMPAGWAGIIAMQQK